MDNQQGSAKQHRELGSVLRGSLDGSGVWGRTDTCICMAETHTYVYMMTSGYAVHRHISVNQLYSNIK